VVSIPLITSGMAVSMPGVSIAPSYPIKTVVVPI
jgi:hypothetical protein